MKKLVLGLLLLPMAGWAQTKNVISTQRIFPKVDKVAAFEKGLSAHAKKYHTGQWKWRIYQIESGPDFGGYMLIEGPNNWEDFGNRGDLGAEHMTDWNNNIAPYLAQEGQSQYMEFNEKFSNVALTDYSKWISINHLYQNPGYAGVLQDMIGSLKKIWLDDKTSVAVYNANASGEPQYAIVTRYKQGLKEKDAILVPLMERFTKANGAGSFDKWVEDYRKAVNKQWSELLSYREDLSSQ
ncbi:MAG TPA: hypothetical protein VLR49_03320 [Ferruginibacter sp.]|nr:hypothetical protein [Ferruginibacter sp.]